MSTAELLWKYDNGKVDFIVSDLTLTTLIQAALRKIASSENVYPFCVFETPNQLDSSFKNKGHIKVIATYGPEGLGVYGKDVIAVSRAREDGVYLISQSTYGILIRYSHTTRRLSEQRDTFQFANGNQYLMNKADLAITEMIEQLKLRSNNRYEESEEKFYPRYKHE